MLWDLLIGVMGGGGFRRCQPVVPVAFGRQDAWRLGAFVTSYVDKLRGDMFNDDVRHRASDPRSLSSSLLVAISDESPGLNTLASVNLLGTGLVVCCKRQANEMFWNIARDMKSSASVKLLGRSIGVTSSCLTFELSTGRVTSASVVIE